MPSFRKLSAAEIAALEQDSLGVRAQIARVYDAYLAGYTIGDYGRAELAAGERRTVVRHRLHAAARRRGLALRFRPGPGVALIFHVEVALPALARPEPPAAVSAQRRNSVPPRREVRPPWSPQRRESAAERYHAVLPRWMREGQPAGRRSERKRRTR
jgi:hypothetical protein